MPQSLARHVGRVQTCIPVKPVKELLHADATGPTPRARARLSLPLGGGRSPYDTIFRTAFLRKLHTVVRHARHSFRSCAHGTGSSPGTCGFDFDNADVSDKPWRGTGAGLKPDAL